MASLSCHAAPQGTPWPGCEFPLCCIKFSSSHSSSNSGDMRVLPGKTLAPWLACRLRQQQPPPLTAGKCPYLPSKVCKAIFPWSLGSRLSFLLCSLLYCVVVEMFGLELKLRPGLRKVVWIQPTDKAALCNGEG